MNPHMTSIKYPVTFMKSTIMLEFSLQFLIYPMLDPAKKAGIESDDYTISFIIRDDTVF